MIDERRQHPRCAAETDLAVTRFNTRAGGAGRAVNYSRFGIYFVSDTALTPGTHILIRRAGCRSTNTEAGPPIPYPCAAAGTSGPEGCPDLSSQALAEVKRCHEVGPGHAFPYGVAARFLAPSV